MRRPVEAARVDTARLASPAHRTWRDSSTCAPDQALRTARFGTCNCNNVWGHERPGLAVHDSPAAGKGASKKIVRSVTTRGFRPRIGWSSHGLGACAPFAFRGGVLEFNLCFAAALGLALARLPAMQQPQAFALLTVSLVPATWRIITAAALAQTDAPREPISPGVNQSLPSKLKGTHGRCYSQRLT